MVSLSLIWPKFGHIRSNRIFSVTGNYLLSPGTKKKRPSSGLVVKSNKNYKNSIVSTTPLFSKVISVNFLPYNVPAFKRFYSTNEGNVKEAI